MSSPSPNSTSSNQEFQGMMKHIDSLYAMAQVLTLDAEKASVLVENTFRRALKIREKNLVVPGDRRHMLQLLIQVYHEQKNTPPPLFDTSGASHPLTPSPKDSFKQNILTKFLGTAVPASFAMMDDSDRLVLSLCESSRLSNADTALILGGDSDAVGLHLSAAKQRLAKKIIDSAPTAIIEILQQSSPDEWIGPALRNSLKSSFNSTPPTLEPKLQSAFSSKNPEAARRALSSSQKANSKPDASTRLSRGLMTIFLILTAGFIGYIGSSLFIKEQSANLLTLSASKAPRVETVLSTDDLSEAEQFVQQQMQWRLSLPAIAQGQLTGVGISEITDEVRVPVFLYKDDATADAEYITLYAFTYALLDQYADRIQLESDILSAIASDNSFDLHDLNDNQKFVIWRSANDIFMAVTSSDPRALRDR
ncbi:MAG: hypothetical protein AB8G77_12200, partial [Rhodothermales bacterium]